MLRVLIKLIFISALVMNSGCSLFEWQSKGREITTNYICENEDISFEVFLRNFSEDKNFQNGRIIFPVVTRSGSYSEANSYGVFISLLKENDAQKLGYPLFRSIAERNNDGVGQEVLLETARIAEVIHFLPEADSDQKLYKFRKINECWYLEEFHDISL